MSSLLHKRKAPLLKTFWRRSWSQGWWTYLLSWAAWILHHWWRAV